MSMINAILDVAGPEANVASGIMWIIIVAIALVVVGGLVAIFVGLAKRGKKKPAEDAVEKKED